PMSAEPSSLDDEFPLFKDGCDALPLPVQCSDLLSRMRQRAPKIEKKGLRFGRARLAVRAKDDVLGRGCISCGLCLYGCVPDAIYSTTQEINRLAAKGAMIYRGGLTVKELRETDTEVDVGWTYPDGSAGSDTYSAVFLALGALNTTRL